MSINRVHDCRSLNRPLRVLLLPALVCMLLVAPTATYAQHKDFGKKNTAKECAICHFMWLYPFVIEQRNADLAPLQETPVVHTSDMCISCHDGSTIDSRLKVFKGSGHRAGILPSAEITIPDNFPLDNKGHLMCTTCHTPHAMPTEGETPLGTDTFIRAPHKSSEMCVMCHSNKVGGTERGNHPVNVSSKIVPREILEHGGRFGVKKTNEVICETCHTAHGSTNNQFLVLPVEDTSLSVLCVVCHGTNPLDKTDMKSTSGSHPVNVSSRKATMPFYWSDGLEVITGRRGEIVCRTCHKPHGAQDKTHLLTEPNYKDSLCVQCHTGKRPIEDSSHDVRIFAPDEINIAGQRADDLGPCSACHLPHGGNGRLMWARTEMINEKTGELCLACHNPDGPGKDVIPEDYSHPMDITSGSLRFLRSKMKIRCNTCHDFHNPFPYYDDLSQQGVKHGLFLRKADQGVAGICMSCHSHYSMVEKTDHDLRLSAPDYKNPYGQTPDQHGVCSPCHLAHKARNQKYLWSAPFGPAILPGWQPEYTSDDNIMIMMCTGCHSPGNCAEKQVPQFGLHPKGFLIPEEMGTGRTAITFETVKNEYPIFTNTGEVTASGNIVCSTCHDPHQWNPHVDDKGPGIEVEGDATNSFLRLNLHADFCTLCHGKDSLIKYKYYHGNQSREKKDSAFFKK